MVVSEQSFETLGALYQRYILQKDSSKASGDLSTPALDYIVAETESMRGYDKCNRQYSDYRDRGKCRCILFSS